MKDKVQRANVTGSEHMSRSGRCKKFEFLRPFSKATEHKVKRQNIAGQTKQKFLNRIFVWFDKGPFKYYVSKDVGGWGRKMAIYADLQYYLC